MSRSPTDVFRNPGGGRRGRRPVLVREGGQPTEPTGTGPNGDGRTITIRQGEQETAAAEGMLALISCGADIFQRDNILVRPAVKKARDAEGREISIPGLIALDRHVLRAELSAAAHWQRFNKDGEARRVDPPFEVADLILRWSGHWTFRSLQGVITTPTLRLDGSMLSAPGFDPASGLYLLAPPEMPEVPEVPTWEDAEAALTLLNGLLAEFPFADGASRSVALSMLLTPVLRGALAPAVPLHVATAPMSGTGKSFLLDLASAIAVGERCPVLSAAPGDPRETEKRLQGAALDGYPIIAIDNLNDLLTGDFLAQLTSAPNLRIRAMGGHPLTHVANSFTTFANGNNITASQDMVRRTLRCGLDADMENPDERVFTADPVEIVLANRGPFVAACLIIARAYLCAGSPAKRARRPGFGRWSDLVRSAICWLNWPDPVDSMHTARAEDPVRQARAAFFGAWEHELGVAIGFTVPELAQRAGNVSLYPQWREASLAVAQEHNVQSVSSRRLGKYLANNANARVGDLKLSVDRTDMQRPRWSLTTG